MMGFGSRDRRQGCTGVHDDIFVRAVYLEHAGEAALIMGFDLCFVGRVEADRFKGAIGRRIDLSPRQILLNASHSHVGPSVGAWYDAAYIAPDRLYLEQLEAAVVRAALEAQDAAREVTIWAGATRSALPLNRRRKSAGGEVTMAPNPDGLVFDHLPICLFQDRDDKPVGMLFSVSCHPSMMSGFEISAEYPGAAMDRLDSHLGTTASLFLQGTGGDAKPSVIGKGAERWRPATWEEMDEAGKMVAAEVIAALETGLVEVEPKLVAQSKEVDWPMEASLDRQGYQAIAADADEPEVKRLWARRMVERLERGQLPGAVTLTLQGVQIGRSLRLVALDGEPVAGWGVLMRDFYGEGVTFALGYSNGEGLYLPTSGMMDEGGYEVVSYWEYGWPARLAKGFEGILTGALEQLRASGIT